MKMIPLTILVVLTADSGNVAHVHVSRQLPLLGDHLGNYCEL